MYFQKLESLKTEGKYSKNTMLIDSLDEWLAFIPKSYKDRLIPELFSINQEVPIDISFHLFQDLVNLGILVEVYIARCECGQVLKKTDSLDSILEFIIEYNENEFECSFCDRYEPINTDNIIIAYKLIERCNMSNFSRKKKEGVPLVDNDNFNLTLSKNIIDNPNKYLSKLKDETYQQALSPEVRSKVNYLLI